MRFHPKPAAPDLSGLFSPYRHCRAVSFHIPVRHAFHLPVPLCSTPVTALLSSYGDSDSSEGLPPNRGLPASRHTSVETILLPNTPGPPTAAFTRYPSARWVSPYGVQTSPLASRLVGVLRPNRFRLLRTGLSPPVASHPASRRRSYLRLPGRRARAWRGLTPLYVCARGRTNPGQRPGIKPEDRSRGGLKGCVSRISVRTTGVLSGPRFADMHSRAGGGGPSRHRAGRGIPASQGGRTGRLRSRDRQRRRAGRDPGAL
jgi:hypothetical protein